MNNATSNDRAAGFSFIAGSLIGLVVMALHPTGHSLFHSGHFQAVLQLSTAVHVLALLSTPLMLLGALGLSRRLSFASPLVLSALVFFGFSLVGVMNAAIMSGLVNSSVARMMTGATPPEADTWSVLFHYTGHLNQAYALVYVVGSSLAIFLWSFFMARTAVLSRGIGIYGSIIAPLTVLAVLSGLLYLNVHGFGAIMLTQSTWFILVGQTLYRTPKP